MNKSDWPRSVEAAVERLMSLWSDEDKQRLRSTPETRLVLFHHSVGLYIRNQFGLWGGNKALLDSCGEFGGGFPDDCSTIIIKAAWNSLHQRPLDYRNRTIHESITCPECGWRYPHSRLAEEPPPSGMQARCGFCTGEMKYME